MIELPRDLLQKIISHARSKAPEEVCGWLAGRGNKVLEIYPVPNVARNPSSRFRMQPEAQLVAMREIRKRGLDLTGTYHSHPASLPYPSPSDRYLALYPHSVHLIVSLVVPEPEARCWRIMQNGSDPLELVTSS